ncbi:DUF5304 domain-containing protein [Streptomyces sp. CC210A]|uniref:DUF5304 domain-containing protein n=1 Tax=Streptomyces sp. CC210A TaxID=2898184 RepID=UPI001F3AD5C1|nr:DUF5304 domain-containing protein [Streptomyces sp. CC210A]
MSDPTTDRPGPGAQPDADAWARACAEDLAAERARRRGNGTPPPGTAAEELRRLVDAVAGKVASLGGPLLGEGAQGAVRHFVDQAKSAVEPVIERNPQVFDHLAAAGSELLAAYRSAVQGHEHRWTHGTTGATGPAGAPGASGTTPGGKDDGNGEDPSGNERIDLD